jgi:hypothetical protein
VGEAAELSGVVGTAVGSGAAANWQELRIKTATSDNPKNFENNIQFLIIHILRRSR